MKKGLIYQPDVLLPWQASHAALPTRLPLGGSRYRVFFSSRDVNNRAHVGSFDFDLATGVTSNTSREPVLVPGNWGYFDCHGVQACSIAKSDNGDLYLYYLGWNTAKQSPLFYAAIGLAISRDGGETFIKYSPAPILQRSRFDPWMVSGGTVIRQGDEWLMYYLSGYKFEFTADGGLSWYDIKIARSQDGIEWTRSGEVALPLLADETNISRMTIDEHNGLYRAWFPVKRRNIGYRCGYAESMDGVTWTRKSEHCLSVSESGWDSEAIDKMEVIRQDDRIYMLYNGNRFGFDGIGLAYSDG
ncbi:hypothetical protein [Synechococcus sp. BIOS-E4-1]|uniref:hypothetical protein n=1 Tax=Synechococcus sp. BIOS-E4-1 TaxID=1400864 RepID=UPI001CA38EF2|nr:hypothetical protein [Synechococcus sp. BIOS-E4-1]